MNKNFLLSLFTMLLISLCSFAQKEYNMVITLNNGTTVTLGHNDIKNITFNDGEVSITGNMVNTIDSLVQATKAMKEQAEERMLITANEVSMQIGFELFENFKKRLNNESGNWTPNFDGVVNALDNKYVPMNDYNQRLEDIYYRLVKLEELHPELSNNNK